MVSDYTYMKNLVEGYNKELEPLLRYMSWLEEKADAQMSHEYKGDGIGENSLAFPVYDSTLLTFVKEVSKTSFMDRNYPYVYSRRQIHTPEDERYAILGASIREWDVLCAILSKYILGGMTRGRLWAEGVNEKIYYLILGQMREIVNYWDKGIPMKK